MTNARLPLHVVIDILSLLPDKIQRRTWCGSWVWKENVKVGFRRLCHDVAYGSSSIHFLSGLVMYLHEVQLEEIPKFWRENIKFIRDVTIDSCSMSDTVLRLDIFRGIHTVRITGGADFGVKHMKFICDTFCQVGGQTHKLSLYDLDNVEFDIFAPFDGTHLCYIHTLHLSEFHDVIQLEVLDNCVHTLRVSNCMVEGDELSKDELGLSGIHDVSFVDCETFDLQ